MLGSAIPRRWVLSLALVGLVSIMVAAYTAMWSDPVWADSESIGTGTGSGTGFIASETVDVVTVPQGIVLVTDQQTLVSATLLDANGIQRTIFPDTTFKWSITSGSGISIVGSDTGRTVTIQGNSPGVTTLQVRVEQGATALSETRIFFRQTLVQVQGPSATQTPITPPTNPGPVPGSIPNADGVLAPEGSLLINPGGVQQGSNPESTALSSQPVLYVQPGSVRVFYGVKVLSVDPNNIPDLPSGYIKGSSAADITFYNQSGQALPSVRLERAAKVCLPVSEDDLNTGGGGFTGVRILRYNAEVGQWVVLNTTYNTITKQACGQSSHFSTFALGLAQVQATQVPGGTPPATGGWSPAASMIALTGLVGFALVGGGVVTMRRARQESLDE